MADLTIKTKLFDKLNLNLIENKLLIEIGNQLTSSLELKTVLTTILDGIKQLVDYDAVGIFVNNENSGVPEHLINHGYDDYILIEYEKKHQDGIINWVFKNREAVVVPDVTKNQYYYEVRKETKSQVSVPLIYKEQIFGTFTLESDHLNEYSEKSLSTLLKFSKQASIAIMNAKLFNDAKQKIALEEEMIHAGNIQERSFVLHH